MINQVKHNPPSSVISQFNPIASLKPQTRRLVNERFILLILKAFFSNKCGFDCFSELDPDKLQTEVEFVNTENFVQTYIYKEIINEIIKQGKKVIFKPKYVITFDRDLTNFKRDEILYPYKTIFQDQTIPETSIKYGVIRLGEEAILYYIFIDLQQIIKFIKTLPKELPSEETEKNKETEEDKRNKLFDSVILEKRKQLRTANQIQKDEIQQEIIRLEQVSEGPLEGQGGKLRINLTWNTTDDLDLHIITPNGEISYNNKTVENQGVVGQLDVDKNAGSDTVSNPQENINFNAMPSGEHKIYVNFFSYREKFEVPFTVTIIPENGEGRIYSKIIKGKGSNKDVAIFENKDGELEFTELI